MSGNDHSSGRLDFVRNGKEAREIYKIGTFYKDADETRAANGFAPNRKPKQQLR